MKPLLFTVLILVMHWSAQAQTEKGRWNAGVSIGSFSYQKTEYGHNFQGSISPSAGYFVATNLLIGTGIPVSHTSQTTSASIFNLRSRQTSIGLSPFVRYYIGSAKLKPYVGLSYSFIHSNAHTESSLSTPSVVDSRSNSTLLTPSLGLAYFLNRTVSLDAQLGYNWYNSSTTYSSSTGDIPEYTYKNVTLGIGFNIFFGN